jgi:hypothetical protein
MDTHVTVTLTVEEARALAGSHPSMALVSAKDKLHAALDPLRDAVDGSKADAVNAALKGMLAEAGEAPAQPWQSDVQTGRGPSGKLRNFAAMKDAKLLDALAAVEAEDNDAEALDAITFEAKARGLR